MNVTSNSNSDSSHEGNGNGGPLSWIGRQTGPFSPPCLPRCSLGLIKDWELALLSL